LRRALGNDGIGPFFDGIGNQVFKLSGFVATTRKAGAIITLDP
jgi:hypothetical protein